MHYTARQIPRYRRTAMLASIALVVGVLAVLPSRAVEFRGLTQIVGLGDTSNVTPSALDSAAASVGGANVSRIQGRDRFQSAAAASLAFQPGGTVIVTTGEVFADALVASPLALSLQAPLLLTERDDLPEATADALQRLAASQVVVVGGYGAVSLRTEEKIADLSVGAVRRVDGPNRWATAAKMSNVTHPLGANRVYVANGGEWTDALPGAMAAAAVNAPLLFVRHGEVTPEAEAALGRLSPQEIVIIGNEASVAETVADALDEIAPLVRRVGGETRFETAAVLAEDTWPDGAEMAFVATGQTFGDALIAAPLMARRANLGQSAFASGPAFAQAGDAEFNQLIGGGNDVSTDRPDIPGGPLLLADETGFLPERAIAVLGDLDANEEAHGGVGGGADDGVGDIGGSGGGGNCTGSLCDDETPAGGCKTGTTCSGGGSTPAPPSTPTPTGGGGGGGNYGNLPIAFLDSAEMTEDGATITIDVLANDLDPGNTGKTIVSVTDPAEGSASITFGGGSVLYTPDADACNDGLPSDSFSYTLSPGGSTATVQVKVDCVPDDPRANDDVFTVNQDSAATSLQVLSNDLDPDEGETFQIASVTAPANGSVALTDSDTRISYTPDAGYCNTSNSTDDFTYTLTPGGATATVAMTVMCPGSPDPVAVSDAYAHTEDQAPTSLPLMLNDTNAGNATISAVSAPNVGSVAINVGNEGVTYTPQANHCTDGGSAVAFTYTLSPGGSVGGVTINISCVDDQPTAVDDTPTVTQNASATTIDVRANDLEPEGDPFIITSITASPANGTVNITNGGDDLTYQPDPTYCNSDSGTPDVFTYQVTGGDTANVQVTVTCTNGAATATDDGFTINEDAGATILDVLANDSDPDGDSFQIISTTNPTAGSVAINPGGASVSYTPNANACNNGSPTDNFTYTVTGGDTATVAMTVTCVNDNPVAVDDAASVDEDDPATDVLVLQNDSDAENDSFTVALISQPDNGTVTIGTGGLLVRYTPDAGYCNTSSGITDDFVYQLNPGASTATVRMTVNCSGVAVANADAATVTEDSAATTVDVRANDSNAGGGPFFITAVTQPANGAAVITNAGLDLTYQPDADYCNSSGGGADTFTYTVTGGSTATVSMTVTCVNDIARPTDDSYTVAKNASATDLTVMDNDSDPEGNAFTITAVTQPANGTVTIGPANAFVRYTPTASYCNDGTPTDDFTYTVTGGNTATVAMTVTCTNGTAVASNDAATVNEDAVATTVDVLANDSDPDSDPFTITAVAQPANGTVAIAGDSLSLTYQPALNYCNTNGGSADTFTYTITGGDTATVSMTVTCVNDPAVANDDPGAGAENEYAIDEDDPLTDLTVLANDTDVEGDSFVVTAVSVPTNGTAQVGTAGAFVRYQPDAGYCGADTFNYTITGGDTATVTMDINCNDGTAAAVADSATVDEDDPATTVPVLNNDSDPEGDPFVITSATQPINGAVVIAGDNLSLTYQPDPNYCNSGGGGPDTFNYTITGGDTATVSMTVSCQPDPAVANNDSSTMNEDAPATTINVLANDNDPDGDAFTISSIVTPPANGTVIVAGDNLSLTYQPDLNYCNSGGGSPDTFVYDITDGDTATVSVVVTCVNDNATANDDTHTTTEDAGMSTITVLANDNDPEGDAMSVTAVSDPPGGFTSINGNIIEYTPDANVCNDGITTDDFTYTITDGDTATVRVSITCSPDDPDAVDDAVSTNEDVASANFTLTSNDVDVDGDDIEIASINTAGLNAGSSATVNPDNDSVNYVPDTGHQGLGVGEQATESITYTVGDGTGRSDTAVVTITVNGVNDQPTAVDDTATVAKDETVQIVVLDDDTDPDDNDTLTLTGATESSGKGTASLNGSNVQYAATGTACNGVPLGQSDSAAINYTISDGNGGTDSGVIVVTITCPVI